MNHKYSNWQDNKDLSGCLVSQSRNKIKPEQKPSMVLKGEDEDLSGCLLSASLPQKTAAQSTNHYRYISEEQDDLQIDQEDLSGCLVSGFFHAKKTAPPSINHRDLYIPISRDDISGEIKRDDEPSGYLTSGFLQSKQKSTKNIHSKSPIDHDDISGDMESSGLGSDWLYLN